jgi:hypothetical protein
MLLRLPPHRGGDSTEFPMIVLNDTGSNTQSIFDADLPHLGSLDSYTGSCGLQSVINADAEISYFPGLLVQVRLVSADGKYMSGWMDEIAIVRADRPGSPRLSGAAVRWHMYTATSARNTTLAIASSKHELVAALP